MQGKGGSEGRGNERWPYFRIRNEGVPVNLPTQAQARERKREQLSATALVTQWRRLL